LLKSKSLSLPTNISFQHATRWWTYSTLSSDMIILIAFSWTFGPALLSLNRSNKKKKEKKIKKLYCIRKAFSFYAKLIKKQILVEYTQPNWQIEVRIVRYAGQDYLTVLIIFIRLPINNAQKNLGPWRPFRLK